MNAQFVPNTETPTIAIAAIAAQFVLREFRDETPTALEMASTFSDVYGLLWETVANPRLTKLSADLGTS